LIDENKNQEMEEDINEFKVESNSLDKNEIQEKDKASDQDMQEDLNSLNN